MAKSISYRTYKNRVFNTMLTECFAKLHAMANGLDNIDEACCGKNMMHDVDCMKHRADMANKMAHEFFRQEMCLKDCTISDTKKKLSEATTFVKDCITLCEDIA